jgi:endo-alpha-1,4-polygalactosaminidase (GH114 family)
MPRIILVATVLLSMTLPATASWAAYYSDRETPEALQPYGLLVLDARYHPPLAPLHAAGKTLYGYVSLGEIELHHPLYPRVRAEGLLLGENPNWKGSYFVDLRDRRWHNHVLQELVPPVLDQGFDGLFLDTLDDAGYARCS